MIKGIELSQRIKFTCSDDTDPKTVVTLRPLSGVEMAELSNFQENGQIRISSDYIFKLLKKTIVQVDNFPHEGSIIDSGNSEGVANFINGLTIKHLGEITAEITKINNITEKDAKN